MPYSESLGLIFFAIPKTGSTSVTRTFRELASSNGEELQLVRQPMDVEFPRSHLLNRHDRRVFSRGKHFSALQLQYVLGKAEFDRCFKFSLVRNPWDRTVSRYLYTHADREPTEAEKKRRGTSRSFHDTAFQPWVERQYRKFRRTKKPWETPWPRSQLSRLVDKSGKLMVDYVGRLENIQDALNHVCREVGCDTVQVPHVNITRCGKDHYTAYYNEKTRDMVGEICREDIEYFNYAFGD
jgi:hypothetical protein